MKLAFISTMECLVFVTTKQNAIEYAKELKSLGHTITNIEIAPLGSSIVFEPRIESYEGNVKELDISSI